MKTKRKSVSVFQFYLKNGFRSLLRKVKITSQKREIVLNVHRTGPNAGDSLSYTESERYFTHNKINCCREHSSKPATEGFLNFPGIAFLLPSGWVRQRPLTCPVHSNTVRWPTLRALLSELFLQAENSQAKFWKCLKGKRCCIIYRKICFNFRLISCFPFTRRNSLRLSVIKRVVPFAFHEQFI